MKKFLGIVLLLLAATAQAQSAPTVNLAWDYVVADEATIDSFDLQRRTLSGSYATLQTVIKTARVTTDTTAVAGTGYCYRMLAQKTLGTPPILYKGSPSNEVCAVALATVLNLRLQ